MMTTKEQYKQHVRNVLEPVDRKLLEYGPNHVKDPDIAIILDAHNAIRELLGKEKVKIS